MAADIAPGMNRSFPGRGLEDIWFQESAGMMRWKRLQDRVNLNIETDIQGYDIDPEALKAARANAQDGRSRQADPFSAASGERASSSEAIWFYYHEPTLWRTSGGKGASVPALYGRSGRAISDLDKWSMYLITSYDKAENDIGRKADKNRKIYNGMLKTYYYQFLGPKSAEDGTKHENR